MAAPPESRCSKCSKPFSKIPKSGTSVRCDGRHGWFHSKCISGLTGDNIILISSLEALGVRWYCGTCDNVPLVRLIAEHKEGKGRVSKGPPPESSKGPSPDLNTKNFEEIESRIHDKMLDSLSMIEKKLSGKIESLMESISVSSTPAPLPITTTKEKVPSDPTNPPPLSNDWASVVRTLAKVESAVSSLQESSPPPRVTSEEGDLTMRQRNVVIFGIPEDDGLDPSKDAETLEGTLRGTMALNITVEAKDVARIGIIKVDSKYPRPIRLVTPSVDRKWDILKRVNGMKVRGVFARPDLNRVEQEADRILREKLKEKRAESGSSGWKIQRGQIVMTSPPLQATTPPALPPQAAVSPQVPPAETV